MSTLEPDPRSNDRRMQDEKIAAEPPLPPPEIAANATPKPLETLVTKPRRHPIAVSGVVENGVVRPIDPSIKLAEHARVIIVAAE